MKLPKWLGGSNREVEPTPEVAISNPAQPPWLRRELALPSWARVAESHSPKVSICIEANTAGYIKEWFALLGVEKADQYWLEVAYQCAKMDLQAAIAGTPFDPRTAASPAEFHFSTAPEWALAKFPKGRGIEAASKGKEAREHYRRIRGRLPF